MPRMLGDVAFGVLPETALFRAQMDAQLKKAMAGAGATVPIRADFKEFSSTAGAALTRALSSISKSNAANIQIRPDTKVFRSTAGPALQSALNSISSKLKPIEIPVEVAGGGAGAAAGIEGTAAGFAVLRKILDDFDREVPNTTGLLRLLGAAARSAGFDAEKMLSAIGGGTGKFRDFGSGAGGAGRGLGLFGFFLRGSIGAVKFWHVALSAVIETLILLASVTAAAAVGALAMSPAIEDLTTNLKAMHTVNEALHQTIGPLTGQIHNLGAAMAPQVVELYGAALGIVGGKFGILQQYGPRIVTLLDNLAAKFTVWTQAQQSGGKIVASGIGYFIQLAHIFGSIGQAIANLIRADPGILRMLLGLLQGFAGVLNVVSRLPVPLLTVALALHGAWVWGNVLGRALLFVADSAKGAAIGLFGLAKNPFVWVAVAAAGLAYLAYESTQADKSTKSFIDNMNAQLATLTASQAIVQISADIGTLNNQISQIRLDTSAPILPGLAFQFSSVKEALHGLRQVLYSSDFSGGFKSIWHAITGTDEQSAEHRLIALRGQIVKLTSEQTVLFGATGHVMQKYGFDVSHAFALIDVAGVKAGDSLAIANAKVDNLVLGYQKLVGNGSVLNNSLNAVTFQALQQQSQIDALTGAWDAFFNTVTGGISGFLNFAQAMQSMDKLLPNNAKAAAALATAQGRVASAQNTLNKLLSSGGPSASAAASATDRLRAAQDHLNILQKTGHATQLQLTAATDRVIAAQDHLNAIQGKAGPSTLAVTAAVDRLRAAQLKLQQVQAGGIASFTGLNANSLQLRQSFLSAAQAAHAQQDALLKLSSAAGLGQTGTDLVTRATKDMIQVMLPAAKQSQELTTVLYILAQQGGYGGANSFKALSAWVGKTKNPMKDLQKVTDTLTTSAANLSQDVKNLSVALGRTLTDAMSVAIFQATGGQKVFTDFATALINTGDSSQRTIDTGTKLAQQLFGLTHSVKDTHDEFIAFAMKALNITAAEAEKLWKKVSYNLTPAIAGVGTTSKAAADKINAHFIKSLAEIGFRSPGINKDVGNFSDAIRKTGDTSDRTVAARDKLIKDLIKAGVQADVARRLVYGLQKQIDGMHGKLLRVGVDVAGTGAVSAHIVGGTAAVQGGGRLVFGGAAEGGRIFGRGGPKSDLIPMMLSHGEFVINALAAQKIGYGNLGKLNKMAGGGIAGVERYLPQMEPFSSRHTALFAESTGTIFAKSAIAEFQKNSFAAVPPGSGLSASASIRAEQLYALKLFSYFGWAANQLPSLIALWNRESGWNPNARNPSSGAFGIPQALPASKMGILGGTWAGQILWGEEYIKGRYGSPANAWAHEVAFNWYDRGGTLKPGPNLMWNGTGRPEHLVPSGGAQNTEVHVHFHGPVGSQRQLQDWLVKGIDEAAKQGRLAYAIRRSPSAM